MDKALAQERRVLELNAELFLGFVFETVGHVLVPPASARAGGAAVETRRLTSEAMWVVRVTQIPPDMGGYPEGDSKRQTQRVKDDRIVGMGLGLVKVKGVR